MQIDYIRRDTPEEISENGGAYIQIVNKDTIGLTSSIEEAKQALYVVGQNSMIEGYFVGLMRSIFEGIKEDGHPRTVGDITFYPVAGGTFDLDKGWDPLVNDVRIKARLKNGVTLDITSWTFRDVTEGRVVFSIDSVGDGTTAGVVSTDKDVEVNGRNFPAKDKLTVSWVCGDKSGTVAQDKFTSNVARITIDKSAFSTLGSTEHGKEIVVTVKGCYNKATAKAVVNYVAPLIHVTLSDLNYVSSVQVLEGTATNVEGVKGYVATSEHVAKFVGDVYVDNVLTKSDLTLEWTRDTSRFAATQGAVTAASGSTVKVVLHIDPEKPAYDPNDVSAETTAI